MANTFQVYEGTDPYIFVSYARRDKERVFPLLDALHGEGYRGEGYRIWRDEGGIPLGSKWRETIADHIERSAVCLLFWSAASSVSQHCEAEIDEMLSEEKTIVTVFLDDTPLTPGLRMYLRRFQSVKLDEFDSDAAFVERLGREEAFKPCREDWERWRREGLIQWKLDTQGVLTIASYNGKKLYSRYPMPDFGDVWNDAEDAFIGSTAPWMGLREEIRAVEIREGIGNIGDRAFKNCKNLEKVEIPSTVGHIGIRAFRDCAALTDITIPNGVAAIGNSAFKGCAGLTRVIIPDSVTSIGWNAFEGCAGLTRVIIPDSVTFIGGFAFSDCAGLTNVTIPDNMTTISDGAFCNCTGLTSVTIPGSVTSIGGYAFWNCIDLTSVIIGESVATIEFCAFYGCTGLTSVIIPAGTELGIGAFDEHVEIVRRPAHRDDP